MYETFKLYLNSLIPRTEDCHDLVTEFAANVEMPYKNTMKVTLLVEETVGMVCAMVEEFEAELWLEGDQHVCKLHLEVLSSAGNANVSGQEAPKGFMAKIADMLQCTFRFDDAESVPGTFLEAIPSYMRYDATDSQASSLMMGQWSLGDYKQVLETKKNQGVDTQEALDELEKSIVARLADEVTVGIMDNHVKLVMTMTF